MKRKNYIDMVKKEKIEMILEEFVKICLSSDLKLETVTGGRDSVARSLADDIIVLKEDETYPVNKLKDKDSIVIYNALKKAYEKDKRYTFEQNKEVFVNIDYSKPYLDDDHKILDQKWHTLISFLAVLDILHYKNRGKITDIKYDYDKEKTTVTFEKMGEITYPSQLMNEWIGKSIEAAGKKENYI